MFSRELRLPSFGECSKSFPGIRSAQRSDSNFRFERKTSFEVCLSPLPDQSLHVPKAGRTTFAESTTIGPGFGDQHLVVNDVIDQPPRLRSEEQPSELQSLMRLSYAVFRLKKQNN